MRLELEDAETGTIYRLQVTEEQATRIESKNF